MPMHRCSQCGKSWRTEQALDDHMRKERHRARPLLMGPGPTKAWVCQRCEFTTENHTEAVLHDEACANPPTVQEVETTAAKLVKMEAELAQGDVGEDLG